MDSVANRKVIEINRIDWSDKAESHLQKAPHTDPIISGLDWHKQNVEKGDSVLFGVFVNGEHKASMLCAVYEGDNGAEYCCEVIGGEDAHSGVMDGLAAIDQLAKKAGCKVIRINTARKGLAKIAQSRGYELTDYILRKKVSDE